MTTTTSSKIICDSVSPAGHRLTTFECVHPRIILAEVNTHKMLSKSSASSRAIPVEKMIARVLEDPYVPTHWGKNQKGMQAEQDVSPDAGKFAAIEWEAARDAAVEQAARLLKHGIHKQITNRLLEPFMFHTALVTGTEWSNFFNLRDNKDAHPDFRDLAHAMRELYANGNPRALDYGDWHTPLVSPSEAFDIVVTNESEFPDAVCKISIGRCARVSYDKQNEGEHPEKSIARTDMMLASGHMAPFEHVARPMTNLELAMFSQPKWRWVGNRWRWIGAEYHENGDSVVLPGDRTHFLGNLNGWVQYRKLIPHEEDILGARS